MADYPYMQLDPDFFVSHFEELLANSGIALDAKIQEQVGTFINKGIEKSNSNPRSEEEPMEMIKRILGNLCFLLTEECHKEGVKAIDGAVWERAHKIFCPRWPFC